MSKEHMPGDATGYKRGAAKGIDGEGKPLAKYGPQRFQKYIEPVAKQAAVSSKVTKHVHKGERFPANQGIDGPIAPKKTGIEAATKFKKLKDWN